MLHDGVTESAVLQRIPDWFQLDSLLISDLDDTATGEIDTDVQLQRKQAEDRQQHQHARQNHCRFAQSHEIDIAFSQRHDQIASRVTCLRP